MLKSAFEWPDASRREYLAGALSVPGTADGDEWSLLAGGLDQEVRGVRLRILFEAIFEEDPEERTGDPRTATRIWLDLLRGEELFFYPDASRSESVVVKPDLSHEYDFFVYDRGPRQYRTLKMKTKERLSTDHPIFDLFTDALTIR